MSNPETSAKPAALLLADRFFSAIERCDMEAVRAIYAPDVLIWHNFDPLEARQDRRLSESVETNLALLLVLPRLILNLQYKVWHEAATASGFVRQHIVQGKTGTGEAVAFPVCAIGEVSNGRITAFYEYLNVGHLPAAVIEYFSNKT